MSTLVVKRIKAFLDKTFTGKIDLTNLKPKTSDEDKQIVFYSRALAAYSLTVIASANEDDAASSITDGYDDNGLDAIYFDRGTNKLWLVQSKFIQSGAGGIDNGDIEKFAKGVKRLINAEFDRFNKKISDRQAEILEAINDAIVKVQIVLAYTGKQLSTHNRDSINDLLQEHNEIDEVMFFHDFNIERAYKGLEAGVNFAPINEDVIISNWGHIAEPFQSYYGQINGSDLASLWQKYGRRLFTENIRSFLGTTNSVVNEEIIKTIKNEPSNFIYFNNGITILCQSIKRKPIGGNDKNIGAFTCIGLSVVNGAQTFGSIGSLADSDPDKLSAVKVFVKFISLEESPEGFGPRITIATNTQNKVDKKDFVSLNSEQTRLYIELKLDNIDYHFKRTDEKIIADENNYLLEEVAFSLACLWNDVDYSTIVKKASGRLWDDIQKKPYTDLFNENVSAQKVIKAVKIFRFITNTLKSLANESEGKTKSINLYGNALISHIVYQKMPKAYWSETSKGFDEYFKNELPILVNTTIDNLHKQIENEYAGLTIVYVLRNQIKCRRLKELIMQQ